MYYKGVYEPNNHEHVAENVANLNQPKNLWAYIISKGFTKLRRKKRGDRDDDVLTNQNSYKESKQARNALENYKTEEYLEIEKRHKRILKKYSDLQMFNDFVA